MSPEGVDGPISRADDGVVISGSDLNVDTWSACRRGFRNIMLNYVFTCTTWLSVSRTTSWGSFRLFRSPTPNWPWQFEPIVNTLPSAESITKILSWIKCTILLGSILVVFVFLSTNNDWPSILFYLKRANSSHLCESFHNSTKRSSRHAPLPSAAEPLMATGTS